MASNTHPTPTGHPAQQALPAHHARAITLATARDGIAQLRTTLSDDTNGLPQGPAMLAALFALAATGQCLDALELEAARLDAEGVDRG